MNRSSLRPVLALLLPAAVSGLAACSDSTSSFDPVALSQQTDAILAAAGSNAALQSMSVLGDKMALGAQTLAATRTGSAAARAEGSATGVFPPGAPVGVTFVYSVAQQAYVASDRPAPSNAVRFILYSIPLGTSPTEIGYVDLLDQTTALGVQAVVTSVGTVLDYTVGVSGVQKVGDLIVAATVGGKGTVTGGALTVSFDTLTHSYSALSGVNIALHYAVSVAEQGLSIDFQASVAVSAFQTFTGTMTIRHGEDQTVVTGSGTTESFNGKITHNGKDVITFSGPSSDPVFVLASGGDPSAEDLAALKKLAAFTNALPCVVTNFLKPATKLFTPAVPSLPCS